MNVGFDYFNTVTEQPEIFKGIANIVHAMDGEVFIISAVSDRSEELLIKYEQQIRDFLFDNEIKVEGIRCVTFKEPKEIPELKRQQCSILAISHFFDDRKDVCLWLNEDNIEGYQVR